MFKVGQIVWCKSKNQYLQTDYHVKCVVTNVTPCFISVRIIEGQYTNNEWDVEEKFFEPVQNRAKLV